MYKDFQEISINKRLEGTQFLSADMGDYDGQRKIDIHLTVDTKRKKGPRGGSVHRYLKDNIPEHFQEHFSIR